MDHPADERIMNDRLAGRLVSPPARASARKRANTDDGTRRETSQRTAMSAEERAKVRKAGAEDARRSRIEQGLPERIEDATAIAILAALLRGGHPAKRNPPAVKTNRPRRR